MALIDFIDYLTIVDLFTLIDFFLIQFLTNKPTFKLFITIPIYIIFNH